MTLQAACDEHTACAQVLAKRFSCSPLAVPREVIDLDYD